MATVYIANRIRFPDHRSPSIEQMYFAVRDYDSMIESIELDFQAQTGDKEDRKRFLDFAFARLELGESRKIRMSTSDFTQCMGYQVTRVQVL